MINEEAVNAFNNRLTANLNTIKTMTPAQLDRVKSIGTSAENLLKNRDFVLFVRQFQLETMDALNDIAGYSEEDKCYDQEER